MIKRQDLDRFRRRHASIKCS